MFTLFKSFIHEEDGQDFAEYALILSAIGVVAIAVIDRYRNELIAAFEAGIEATRKADRDVPLEGKGSDDDRVRFGHADPISVYVRHDLCRVLCLSLRSHRRGVFITGVASGSLASV